MGLNEVSYKQLLNCMKACSKIDSLTTDSLDLRIYIFNPDWKEDVALAKYRDGAGNDIYFIFKNNSVLAKGFDHESEVSRHAREDYEIWPGMYHGVPHFLLRELNDDAVEEEDVTFCFWLLDNETEWKRGPVELPINEDDGSSWLRHIILLNTDEFDEWAVGYYEDTYTTELKYKAHEIYAEFSL